MLFLAYSAQATVSYWDPAGARFGYTVYTGGVLDGTWENNSWARNTGGASGPPADKGTAPIAFTDGDAVVFAVGAGATNSGTAASTTTFTVTMNANHTIAGIFDGTLNPHAGKVTLTGSGTLTLASGLDAFSLGTNGLFSVDGSVGQVTVGVSLTGPGTMINEGNGGTLFLMLSNSYAGGTILGFSNAPFNGNITFNNNSAFGTGPIIVSNGVATLQCTNSGLIVTNGVDFSQASTITPTLNLIGTAAGVTFSGDMIMAANTPNIGSAGAAGTLVTLSGNLGGSAGFTKTGSGTLTLAGTSTYSGGTTVNAGTLQIGTGGASGAHGSGSISIASGATLTYNKTGTVTENEQIGGAGNVTQAGGGTLILNNANTYSGVTTISSGTLQLLAANNIPSSSPVKVNSGAVLDLNGFSAVISALSGSGNVINDAGNLTVNGNLTTLGVANNPTYSGYSGVISGAGTLDKDGTHAMALRGVNTFSGGLVQVESGTLSVGAGPNRLPTSAAIVISGGAQFQLDAASQTISALSGAGNVNLGGGTLTVNQSGGSTLSGVIQNSELAGASTASGNGLRGYYYDNIDFTNLKAVRNDATVNFASFAVTNNTTGLPNAGIATNTLSVRWLGQVLTTGAAGSYVFGTTCDDGSRLWVNGTLVVDNWVDQGAIAKYGTITLAANTLYDIVMEYYNNGGPSSSVLSWAPPSSTTNAIPSPNLFLPAPGLLIKTGGGILNLSGVNTYTGSTIVGGGTLEISSANGLASPSVTVTNGAILKLDSNTALNPQALLVLNTNSASPGFVNLNFAGTAQLGLLSLDGGNNFAPSGTWGAVGSGASHTSSRFTGAGLLNISVCSATNSILSISNNLNNSFTLKMQGTFGASYYLVSQTNITQSLANWQIVPASTNTVGAANGIWTFTATNKAPAYFRVKAINSCN